MAIGTPYSIGQVTTASGSSATVAVGTATTAGDAIFVGMTNTTIGTTVTGITDTKGNVYALAKRYNAAGSYDEEIWAAVWGSGGSGTNTAALTTSDTITVTWTGTPGSPRVGVMGCSGIANNAAVDQSAGTNGTSASQPNSGNTGTLAQTSELAVGVIANANAGGAVSWTAPWASVVAVPGGAATFLGMGYQITSSTAAVAAQGTITATTWTATVATFKAAPPTITTSSLPNGTSGTAYSQTLAATGGSTPYTWSLNSGTLPTGLTLSSAGVISGTPSAAGTYSFVVKVTDNVSDTATASLSITIAAAASSITRGNTSPLSTAGAPAVTITWGTNPVAGQKVILTLWTGNNNIPTSIVDNGTTQRTFQLASSVVNPTSLLWCGIYYADNITLPASGNYAVTVNNPNQHGMYGGGRAYSGVNGGAPTSVNSNFSATAGTAHDPGPVTPAGANGLAVSVFVVANGANPETQTPAAGFTTILAETNGAGFYAGASADDITATGSVDGSWTTSDSVGWAAAAAAWDVAVGVGNAIQDATVGFFYSETLTATSGVAPYTWSVTSGALPPGLTLSTGGQITGTPTITGTYTFTAQAADSKGGTATESLSITVVQPTVKAVYGQISYGEVTYDQLQAASSVANIPTLALVNNTANPYPLATNQAAWVAEPFIAQSLNYNSVGVSWTKPIAAASATRWRLIANRYGYPVDQNDGNLLIDQPTWPGTFYLDQNVIPGSYHYYGLYAQTDPVNNIWQRAAVTGCLTTENAGKSSWLQSHLPEYFTKYLNGSLTQDAEGNTYLAQFLQVLGWGLDYVQGQYDMIFRHVNDPMAIPVDDLANLATTIGLPFDPMISVYLMRKAAANWAHVAEERGTALGMANQMDLLTGFGVDLQIGSNLMLDNDQSYFPDPAYPAWNQYTSYKLGEIVSSGWFLYSCAIAGSVGIAPTGTYLSNANWSVVGDWTEPTGLLINPNTGGVGTWEAVYPGQVNGVINVVRGQQSTLAEPIDGGAYTWAVNPTAGQKILFAIWSTSTETITLVKDNGTTPTTFTLDLTATNSSHQVWLYHADNITLPASGSYTVTVTTGAQSHHVGAIGVAYSGLQPGSPYSSAPNTGNTNNNPPEIVQGGVGVPLNGGVVMGAFADDSANLETITLHNPNGLTLNSTGVFADGTTGTPGGAADGIVSSGQTTFWYWTLTDFANWASVVAVYPAAQQYVLDENIGDRDPSGTGLRNMSTLTATNQMSTAQDIYTRSISRTLADKANSTAVIPYGIGLSAPWNPGGSTTIESFGSPAWTPATPSTTYSGGFYVWANQPWAAGANVELVFYNGTTYVNNHNSANTPLTTTPQLLTVSAACDAGANQVDMAVKVLGTATAPSNLVVYVQPCPAPSGAVNWVTGPVGQGSGTWAKDTAPYPTITYGNWAIPSIYVPDSLQVVNDGIPVPFTLPSQLWSPTVRYGTGQVVTWQWQPFIARRASTGATPPPGRTPSPEWYPASTDPRLRLMVSAKTAGVAGNSVIPFVEWYDIWGNLITRVTARTPTANTPGIPDQLAFDGFLLSPGSIGGRSFDNAYASTWTAQDNNFTVSPFNGGVAYPSSTARSVALTTGVANCQVGVTLAAFAQGTQQQGIVFRWSSETAYWKATTTALVKNNGGTLTTTPYSTVANPGDRIVVQMNGSVITVLLNGVTVASVTDAFNSTATQHGMIVE